MSTLRILLNIALWLLVTNAKTSLGERYPNVLSSHYEKSSSYDRPFMVLDKDSKQRHRNDYHITSQKGYRNDLDDSAENSSMNDDVPYAFLYLYKLLQQIRNKYDKQYKNSKYDSSLSSVGNNRRPYHNRENRNNRWRDQHNGRYKQRNYRHRKYEDNYDRYGNEDEIHSRPSNHKRVYENNHWHNYDDSYRNKRYNHHHHINDYDRSNRAQNNNRLSGMNLDSDKKYHDHYNRDRPYDEIHHYRYDNRHHKNVDRYENKHDNRHHIRYQNTHDKHHNEHFYNERYNRNRDLHHNHENNRYRYIESEDMTNGLSKEDREMIKLQQNVIKSPLIKNLLGISNSLRQRETKDSCASGDSCEQPTEANIVDDPCEENSNSCGEEEDKNPSTKGIVNDYVSDPPPKLCEPGETC